MTLAERIRQQGIHEGIQQGIRQGLLEAIELGISLRFGAEGSRLLHSISQIKDINRLKAIKEAVKTVNTLDELRTIVEE